MHPIVLAIIALAGIVAGAANVLAGAGSLLTYPILVAVGLSPLAANVTNDAAIVAEVSQLVRKIKSGWDPIVRDGQ